MNVRSALARRPSPFLALLLAPLVLAMTCEQPAEPAPSPKPAPRHAGLPPVRLRISGSMEGRLEPCGCASGQLGGLPRRVFYLNQKRDWDLLIEGGNLVTGGTVLDAEKLRTALQILSMPSRGESDEPGYDVLGIGPADLQLPRPMLALFVGLFSTTIKPVASDLVAPDAADETWPVAAQCEAQAGGARVRFASLTLTEPKGDGWDGFTLLAPEKAWERAMQGVGDDTYRILLVHGTAQDARAQAALRPRPDLIIGITDEISEPTARAEPADGIPVVFPGTRGRMVVEATLERADGEPRLTHYRAVPLAGSETVKGALEDSDAKLVLLQHRQEVAEQGVREQMAERLPVPGGARYVGNAACADCHEEAVESWKTTEHAQAWATLEEAEKGERYGWPVTAYPDCVGCHVVGYGYESGFVNPDKTPQLENVGCESCHGPSSEHVESGGEVAPPADAAAEDGKIGVAACVGCHDFEQSPGFHAEFPERWKKIEHW